MARPGVEVLTRAERPRRGLPTDTGVLFAALTTARGPAGRAVPVSTFAEFVEQYGGRQPYNAAAVDTIEAYFATGGATAYVSRVVGPAAAEAFVILDDLGAADALRVEAIGPGSYANGFSVEVAAGPAGDAVTLIVRDAADLELERYDVADAAEAALVMASSRHVRGFVIGDGGVLAVAPATDLAGGDDDRAAITDVQRDAALAAMTADLGPGQVIAPERTDAAGHRALMAHAAANNRAALLDPPRDSAEAALTALAAAIEASPGADAGAVFADWLLIAGVGSSTAPRAIPPSGVVAGLIARGDALNGVGDAPAGDAGFVSYVLGVAGTPRTDAERTRLNAAGVNVFRSGPNGTQLYGFRSVTSDPAWRLFTWHRLRMSLTARLAAVAEPFLFRSIDGRGLLLAELRGALLGVMAQDYARGDLFGETPEEAFDVDVSGNLPATLELGDVYAIAEARFSPFVERARIELVKAALTSSIA